MPETHAPGKPVELAPDRERDAGFRGEAYTKAALMFGLVFVTGFAIVGVLAWSRRRRKT
ncbi:MAG: hypothetical protein K8T90_03320 [Planctomycetes bacterium]|nr:hypothetical protein [Planctomycetota bacterium]